MKPTVKTDTDGTKSWWLNGERHREDGPAIEYANGGKEWWLNGKQYTEKEYWVQLIRSGLVKRDNPKVLSGII